MNAVGGSALGLDRPFPGLRPFAYADHAFFFGRTNQTYALYRMLDRGRFVAVVGSSGCGKSSLVFAGLLPLLDKERQEPGGRQWIWRDMEPGDTPLETLIALVHSLALELAGQPDDQFAAAQRDRVAYLIRNSSRGLVEALAEIDGLQDKTLVLVVDQFEELFRFATTAQSRERSSELKWREDVVLFVQLLLVASRHPDCNARFILTMRSDFIGDCARFQGLPEAVSEAQFLVPSLRRDQLEDIICKPIARAGGSIDPMLVKRLLTDAGDEPDQLPVLQHCLARLWEEAGGEGAGAGRHLTLDHYELVHRMNGALSQHADEILSTDLAGLTAVVERVFRALSELDRDGRAIRRAVPFGQLMAETGADEGTLRKVIDRLRADDCSFLRPPPIKAAELARTTRVDVGHEALLRRWEKISGEPGATGEPNNSRPVGWLREEDAVGRRYQALLSLARSPGRTVLPREQIAWWDKRLPSPAWADRYGGGHQLVERLIEDSRLAIAAEQERKRKEIAAQETRKRFVAAVSAAALIAIAVFAYERNQYAKQQTLIVHQTNSILAVTNSLITQSLASLNAGQITVAALQRLLEPIMASNFFDRPANISETPQIAALKANVLIIYSDTMLTIGDKRVAFKEALQAKALADKLLAIDSQNQDWQRLKYEALFRIGDLLLDNGKASDRARGLQAYKEAQKIAQHLADVNPGDGDRLYDLAFITNKIGETFQKDDVPGALKQFHAALKDAQIIAAKPDASVKWKLYLPITLYKLGLALTLEDPPALQEAQHRYQKALTRLTALSKQSPDNVSVTSNLARIHRLMGNLLATSGVTYDFERAQAHYEMAISLGKRLVGEDPGNALWLEYLEPSYVSYGDALKSVGDIKGAAAQYGQAVGLLQKLVQKGPDWTRWKPQLAKRQGTLAALKRKLVSPATGAISLPSSGGGTAVPKKVEAIKVEGR